MFSFSNFDQRIKEKGITKTFIAQKLGKNSTIFNDWSKGKSNPSDEALAIVAMCLDCTVSYLRGQTSDPQIEVIPADPEMVREEEALLEKRREESQRQLYEAMKIFYEGSAQTKKAPAEAGTEGTVEADIRLEAAGLSDENKRKTLEYMRLLALEQRATS